jgi:hypothetical protein
MHSKPNDDKWFVIHKAPLPHPGEGPLMDGLLPKGANKEERTSASRKPFLLI